MGILNSIAVVGLVGSISIQSVEQVSEHDNLARFSGELNFLLTVVDQASAQQRVDAPDYFDYSKLMRNIEYIRRAIDRHIHSPHTSVRAQPPLTNIINVALSTSTHPTDPEYYKLQVFIDELNRLIMDVEHSVNHTHEARIIFNYPAFLYELINIHTAVTMYLDNREYRPRYLDDLG